MINSKLLLRNQTKKLSKKFEIWVKKSISKIPEIDLDIFRLF